MAQPFPVSRFLGRALIALARISAVFLSLALLAFPLQGDSILEFNQGAGASVLETLMHPWLTIVLGIAMLAYLVARFKVIPKPNARVSDLLYLAIVIGLLAGLQAIAYLAVLQAPHI
ncbi:hypothetical protein ACFOZ5_00015 [Marinobacter lacisalsi]|uniref:Uncharacterized protein n=1 Tax=Marinobacter lacisalsi TaxID=475979 RepID=A0ABV8QBS1_9GAMM